MCVAPITIKQRGEIVNVPCNRCYQCILKRKREWEIRITQESYVADLCFFSLISYNPEHLPDPDLPDKRAIQLLVKQLRTNLNRTWKVPELPGIPSELQYSEYDTKVFRKDKSKPITLKYFIVSEYGETRARLHYHAIFFLYNVDKSSLDRFFWKGFLEVLWNKGFCSAFYLDPQTISYCCKYIQKSYNMLMSSRLGKSAFLDYSKGVLINPDQPPFFQLKGRNFLPPRSWQEGIQTKIHNLNINPMWGKKLFYDHEFDNPTHQREFYVLANEKHYTDNPHLVKSDIKHNDNSDLNSFSNGECF